MKRRKDYLEFINGFQQSLNRKEAVLQANYLIKKECYESAYVIIEAYDLNVGELLVYDLVQEDYEKFIKYIKDKSV